MSIRTILALVLAAALAAGVWWHGESRYQAGYAARDAIVVRDQIKANEHALAQGEKNLQAARAEDKRLQAEAAAEKKAHDARAARLDQVLTTQEKTYAAPQQPTASPQPVLLGGSVLDVFTLCLLNAERAGASSPGAACAPERTDAEIDAAAATPTEVGGGDLARNDLEVTRLYNDLAKRCDRLVDWVDANIIKGKN